MISKSEMVQHKAILIEASPKLKCCIFTPKYGPIIVASNENHLGQPDVDSISLIRIDDLASTFTVCSDLSKLGNLKDYEESIFTWKLNRSTNSVNDGNALDRDQHQFMEDIAQMKGLKERLIDTSLSLKIDASKGILLEFLNRSEAILQELLGAHLQYNQKQEQSKKKYLLGSGGTEAINYSIEYLRSLHRQCDHVQKLLDSMGGDEHTFDLNDELTKITIQFTDAKKRVHVLVGELSLEFPSVEPIWTCDLPTDFQPEWKPFTENTKNSDTSIYFGGGLYDCVKSFVELISLYQSLWNELDDIDTNCWVIEPTLPSKFSCADRRVMLRPGLSIAFSIEPENPRSLPLSMRLIGKDDEIDIFRDRYTRFTSKSELKDIFPSVDDPSNYWSKSKSLRQNIEVCFGVELPQSSINDSGIDHSECAVCYVYNINTGDKMNGQSDELPDVKCSNTSCARSYHRSCLIEWLQSLPGSKTSFGRVFGSCPYCYESISVSATK